MRIEIGPNEAGQRLDKFCRKWLEDVPLGAIFKALRKGDIRVNGKKAKQNYFLEEEDVVENKVYWILQEKQKKCSKEVPRS